MQDFDKRLYKRLKLRYPEAIFAKWKVTEDYAGKVYNGLTVVAIPVLKSKDCKMMYVAVSYCSTDDSFSRKVGRYQALLKLDAGEYIQLPILHVFYKYGKRELKDVLEGIFAV